jgi:hypothetical protein
MFLPISHMGLCRMCLCRVCLCRMNRDISSVRHGIRGICLLIYNIRTMVCLPPTILSLRTASLLHSGLHGLNISLDILMQTWYGGCSSSKPYLIPLLFFH